MPGREALPHLLTVIVRHKQMAGRAKVAVEGFEHGQEALSMARRFEALQVQL